MKEKQRKADVSFKQKTSYPRTGIHIYLTMKKTRTTEAKIKLK